MSKLFKNENAKLTNWPQESSNLFQQSVDLQCNANETNVLHIWSRCGGGGCRDGCEYVRLKTTQKVIRQNNARHFGRLLLLLLICVSSIVSRTQHFEPVYRYGFAGNDDDDDFYSNQSNFNVVPLTHTHTHARCIAQTTRLTMTSLLIVRVFACEDKGNKRVSFLLSVIWKASSAVAHERHDKFDGKGIVSLSQSVTVSVSGGQRPEFVEFALKRHKPCSRNTENSFNSNSNAVNCSGLCVH